MGCICSKGAHPEEEPQPGETVQREKASSRRGDVVVVVATDTDDGGTVRLLPKSQENSVSTPPAVVVLEGKNMVPVHVVIDAPAPRKQTAHRRRATVDGRNGEVEMVLRFPNVAEAEHVAAGWPSWLASVAGEAINGWVPMRPDAFEKLDKIGQGTYSSVYKARDLETGKIVALKKVRFVNMDPESVRFMAREIHVLRRLDHPNIVKLEGLITSRASSSLYLVFEYMEHDLAGLAATPGIKFTEPQVKCYMQQLLNGLHHCHSRGILHRDIKGSNLLIDDNGILKIADFGLATLFDPDNKQPLTSRVVTLWYRPPELLLGATDYGVAVDLWSTGCILAELLAGKPIMPGRTEVEQMHKIFKLCGSPSEEYWTRSKLPHATIFKPQHPYRRCVHETFKDFPPSALALLDTLLAIRPEERGTTASALTSDFFTTEPYACYPSNLPKYPPSKEFDAKLREEEAMRQRMEANPANGAQIARETSKRVTDNTTSGMPLQRTQTRQISRRDRSDLLLESGGRASGTARNVISHSGPLVHPVAFGHSLSKKVTEHENRAVVPVRGLNAEELKTQKSYMPQGRGGDLSILPGLATARATAKSENHREKGKHTNWPENRLDVVEASDMQEWRRHVDLDAPSCSSSNKKNEANMGYGTRKNRIHYSGPLMPPGGNLEEMLKEHERQIQQAVRKARLDKAKTNKNFTDHRPI